MIGSPINFQSADGMTDFIINDRSASGQPNLWADEPFYYISVVSVDGLYGADLSTESHPTPNFIGEKSGDIIRRGKTITLSGNIQALSLGALETGAEYLQEMFADRGFRKLIYTRYSDGVGVYYIARVNQDLSISQTFSDKNYKWGFTVAVRADDPRTYKTSGDTLYPSWQE